MSYLSNAGVFLLNVVLGLSIVLVLLRFLLQQVRADFYNPLCQFLVKASNPVLLPLRRVIPGFGGIDVASLVLAFVLQCLLLLLVWWLQSIDFGVLGLLLYAVAELINRVVWIMIFSLLIMIIISWVNPGAQNPVMPLLYRLNEPLLRPMRSWLPTPGGLDLSPLVILVLLHLTILLLVMPMRDAAVALF
jgi:YggT family protein